MSISTNSNILIQGNTIDYGTDADAIHGNGYNNCIALNLDSNQVADPEVQYAQPGYAQITSNFLSGIDTTSVTNVHIVLLGGSTIITDNTFIGPGLPNIAAVKAYITVNSPNDQVITNNIFDSPTVDGPFGVNETLVLGVGSNGFTSTSTYHSNKNQTGYLPISKVPNLIDFKHLDNSTLGGAPTQAFYFYDSDPAAISEPRIRSRYGSFATPGGDGYAIPTFTDTNNYVVAEGTQILWDTTATVANVKYTITIDVDEYLPPNVQILNFVIGLSADADITPNLQVLTNGTANSFYAMWANSSVSKNPNIAYSPSGSGPTLISNALAGTVADVKNTVISGPSAPATTMLTVAKTGITGSSQVTPTQLAAATQYLFIDVSGEPQFYTVPNTRITVTYQAITEADATQGGGIGANGCVDVYESPLIVKYRW
jgi:hypothetical protein